MKRVFQILITIWIVSIIFSFLNDDEKETTKKEEINLQKISDDLNKDLPIDTDVKTTWTSTSVMDSNTILFNYEIQDSFYINKKNNKLIPNGGTKINWESLINHMKDVYCNHPQMKLYKNEKINCKVKYVDLNNLLLNEFIVTHNDCN